MARRYFFASRQEETPVEHGENSFLEKEPVGKLMMKYAVPCINTDYMSTDDAAALIARAAIGRRS